MNTRHEHQDLPFEPPSLAVKAALSMMRATTLLSDELDREMGKRFDLNFSDVMVLVQVALAGGRLRMADVADTVVVTRGGVTKLVDRLVGLGYLRRAPSESDRRVIYAEMTHEARNLLREAQTLLERVVRDRVGDVLDTDTLDAMHLAAHKMSCENPGWALPVEAGHDLEPAGAID